MILYVDFEEYDEVCHSYPIKTTNEWVVGELFFNAEAFSIIIYDFIVEDAFEEYPDYPEQ